MSRCGRDSTLSGVQFPAKELGLAKGTQGNLTFAADPVVFDSPSLARTWRYHDIQFITTADPFQLPSRLWKSSSIFN